MAPDSFQRWIDRLLSFLSLERAQAESALEESRVEVSSYPVEAVAPETRKVSLIVLDPLMDPNGRRMSELLHWNDPDRLTGAFISDLREASYGYVNYQVAERIMEDSFPLLADGFQYTPEEFLRCRRQGGWHKPEGVDYHALLARYDLIARLNRGEIDEVWTQGFPYGGFYESRMAGPGAFWCNAPPLENTQAASRRFVIMGFSFERGAGEMLESYGHRAESILAHVFKNVPPGRNLWERFTRHESTHPGQAEVGNIHFAPNSRRDYDWGNPKPALSRSRVWLNFPDLTGEPRLEDCREWGNGDIRQHHLWWFRHLPHIAGETDGILNNWWAYILDPNLAG
jgi:hypothetical protein